MITLKVIFDRDYNPNKLSKGYYKLNKEYNHFPEFRLQKDLFTLFGSATFGVTPEVQRKEIWADFQKGLNRPQDFVTNNTNNYFDWFKLLIEAEREYGEVTLLCNQCQIDYGITELILKAIEWLKTQI